MPEKERTYEYFTLFELVKVMVVITVLVAVAVPTYFSFKKRALATEAMATLDRICKLEFQYRSRFGRYSTEGGDIGLTVQSDSTYKYELLGATVTEFSARATANLDRDATLDVWLIDQTGALRHVSRD